jgi:secondary thiamine-phosphate synthase enzyme
MEALKARESGTATLDCYVNEGIARSYSRTIEVTTNERTELINLTAEVKEFVEAAGVKDGYVQVSSMHTTAGLIINEWQEALLADVKEMMDSMVPREQYYRHNDPELSDCDRHNADSHLRMVVFGHSLTVPISQGAMVLGRWQSVILTEFDGPNQRKIFMQVFGI